MNAVWWRQPAVWVGLGMCMLGGALSVPPARSLIEQSMVWHMVVQMPMLVSGGWLLMGNGIVGRHAGQSGAWNQYGLTSFLVSQFIAAYWMLPLAIDRAVVLPQVDTGKILSLVFGGALLKTSFKRSPVVLQLFFVGYLVSMLIFAGAYLATTDRRLCNAYSLVSQLNAGGGVMVLGVALAFVWVSRVFHAHYKNESSVKLCGEPPRRA